MAWLRHPHGVWKFSVDHTFNTWTAGYDGGWARSPGRNVPGQSRTYRPDTPPSLVFQMFPTVYQVPFHYANPVSGRASGTPLPNPPPAAAVSHVPPATDFGMPADIAAELRAIGARIEAQKTGELYAGLQPKEPYSWLEVTRDLHYGPAERNVLDVFTVPQHGQGKPMVVFVHGGGFARGSKHTEGTPFYDNVGLWAASYGVVGVTVNYAWSFADARTATRDGRGARSRYVPRRNGQAHGSPRRGRDRFAVAVSRQL